MDGPTRTLLDVNSLAIGFVAVWGIWWEVRLLMPLYPVLFALALSYLYEPLREPRDPVAAA